MESKKNKSFVEKNIINKEMNKKLGRNTSYQRLLAVKKLFELKTTSA